MSFNKGNIKQTTLPKAESSEKLDSWKADTFMPSPTTNTNLV